MRSWPKGTFATWSIRSRICAADSSCEYTDRIELGIVTDSAELRKAITDFADYVQSETLSIRISFEALPGRRSLGSENRRAHGADLFARRVQ